MAKRGRKRKIKPEELSRLFDSMFWMALSLYVAELYGAESVTGENGGAAENDASRARVGAGTDAGAPARAPAHDPSNPRVKMAINIERIGIGEVTALIGRIGEMYGTAGAIRPREKPLALELVDVRIREWETAVDVGASRANPAKNLISCAVTNRLCAMRDALDGGELDIEKLSETGMGV